MRMISVRMARCWSARLPQQIRRIRVLRFFLCRACLCVSSAMESFWTDGRHGNQTRALRVMRSKTAMHARNQNAEAIQPADKSPSVTTKALPRPVHLTRPGGWKDAFEPGGNSNSNPSCGEQGGGGERVVRHGACSVQNRGEGARIKS